MALYNYIELPMLIVYLDNSPTEVTHDLTLPEGQALDAVWLRLLYRPGHYDLIYTA